MEDRVCDNKNRRVLKSKNKLNLARRRQDARQTDSRNQEQVVWLKKMEIWGEIVLKKIRGFPF